MAVILFVEDDLSARRNIALFLRRSGYEVFEVENGESAVALLARMKFDVVISDLNLPGQLNGTDILHRLRQTRQKIDAILITACGSDEVADRAKSLGAVYMEKPIQLQELKRTIQQRPAK